MELSDIRHAARSRLGIEIEPQMTAYLQRLLTETNAPKAESAPIIGADARTGMPVRMLAPLNTFQANRDSAAQP